MYKYIYKYTYIFIYINKYIIESNGLYYIMFAHNIIYIPVESINSMHTLICDYSADY